jgi:tripartite-type tricarboxylate transporter receptor subunit TctC
MELSWIATHTSSCDSGVDLRSDSKTRSALALITSPPTALPHIKSGKLQALMVTSEKRSALLQLNKAFADALNLRRSGAALAPSS